MGRELSLSPKTKKLISQIKNAKSVNITFPLSLWQSGSTQLEERELVNWLNRKLQLEDENYLLLAALQVSLLKDLRSSLIVHQKDKKKKGKAVWSARIKYVLLVFAGTLYFGCNGFDAIVAILGIFSLPTLLVFIAGMVFSTLSILAFYAFDLVAISHNLGVKPRKLPQLLRLYAKEVNEISKLREELNSSYTAHELGDLRADLALIQMLNFRYHDLDKMRANLIEARDNKLLGLAKYVVAAISGLIFFGGGYSSAQTVVLAVASLFFTSSISLTAWPVIAACTIVGLAAFSVYWFVERPGVENLISRLFGLDEEKIEELCAEESVLSEKAQLQILERSVQNLINRQEGLEQLRTRLTALEKQARSDASRIAEPDHSPISFCNPRRPKEPRALADEVQTRNPHRFHFRRTHSSPELNAFALLRPASKSEPSDQAFWLGCS